MSLKAFHLFFIAVSIVCAFGFTAWCVKEFMVQPDSNQIVMAVLSFIAGIGLIVYGVKVRRKLKSLREP
jgi:hypothetical protein